MASVNIGRNRVTDKEILSILQAMCEYSGNNINVIMGERIPPKRYLDKTNPHHFGLAVDFHMEGASDELAFQFIKGRYEGIFSRGYGYQLIWHGKYIAGQRPCLCLARFTQSNLNTLICIKGGDRFENMDKYWMDDSLLIRWGRGSYVGHKLSYY